MSTVPCPMCGSENATGAQLCGICGCRLQEAGSTNRGGNKCARCGSAVPGGFDFCPVCGQDQRQRHARPVTQIMRIDKGASQPPSGAEPPQPPPPPAPQGAHPAVGAPVAQPPAGPPPFAPQGAGAPYPPSEASALYAPLEVGGDDATLPAQGRNGGPTNALHSASSRSDPELDPSVSYTAGMRPAEERHPTIPEGRGPQLVPSTLPGQEARGHGSAAAPGWVPPQGYAPSSTPTAPGSRPARLVLVRRDGTEGDVFPLPGPDMTVGRSHAELTFPDDPFLSPLHARIERAGEAFTLTDMGSRNGIYLRVRGLTAVYPGDLFMVGHHLLRLESAMHSMQESPVDADGTREFGTPLEPAWGRLVLVGRGGILGDTYHLRGSEILFGRETGDIVFPHDPFVSREHARLRLEIEGSAMAVYLEDLGSANGTYIRIRGSVEVRGEDTFRVGDQILRLRVDA